MESGEISKLSEGITLVNMSFFPTQSFLLAVVLLSFDLFFKISFWAFRTFIWYFAAYRKMGSLVMQTSFYYLLSPNDNLFFKFAISTFKNVIKK